MLKQGAAGLGIGVLKGATGIIYEPLKGARRHGARGFAVGVGKGLAGAALRPTAGLLKLADSWAGAWVLLTTGLTGEGSDGSGPHGARIGRVRPPRMLHDHLQRIAPFAMSEGKIPSHEDPNPAPLCFGSERRPAFDLSHTRASALW